MANCLTVKILGFVDVREPALWLLIERPAIQQRAVAHVRPSGAK
jgi:hypothetical protein